MKEPTDPRSYAEWKRAKVERGLRQARDRAAMIPAELVLDELAADARAEADVREGRLISHEAVKRWIASLGDEEPLSRPRIGD